MPGRLSSAHHEHVVGYEDVTMTLAELSEWLCVSPADVAYVISEVYTVDLHDDAVPVALCGDLKTYFEPAGERTGWGLGLVSQRF